MLQPESQYHHLIKKFFQATIYSAISIIRLKSIQMVLEINPFT